MSSARSAASAAGTSSPANHRLRTLAVSNFGDTQVLAVPAVLACYWLSRIEMNRTRIRCSRPRRNRGLDLPSSKPTATSCFGVWSSRRKRPSGTRRTRGAVRAAIHSGVGSSSFNPCWSCSPVMLDTEAVVPQLPEGALGVPLGPRQGGPSPGGVNESHPPSGGTRSPRSIQLLALPLPRRLPPGEQRFPPTLRSVGANRSAALGDGVTVAGRFFSVCPGSDPGRPVPASAAAPPSP